MAPKPRQVGVTTTFPLWRERRRRYQDLINQPRIWTRYHRQQRVRKEALCSDISKFVICTPDPFPDASLKFLLNRTHLMLDMTHFLVLYYPRQTPSGSTAPDSHRITPAHNKLLRGNKPAPLLPAECNIVLAKWIRDEHIETTE